MRRQQQLEDGLIAVEPGRRRVEIDACDAHHAVKPAIAEQNRARAGLLDLHVASSSALGAADLEKVGEVGRVSQAEPDAVGGLIVIAQRQPLIAATAPEEFRPNEVDGLARKNQAAAAVDV